MSRTLDAEPARARATMKARLERWAVRGGLHHAARERARRSLLIVCHHGLRRDADPRRHWLLMPESSFARQMEYLARHYECVPIDDGVARLAAGTLRRPTACVTFDDGYRSNVALAEPILARLGIPATVYLATGLVGTTRLLWTTALELAVAETPLAAVDVPELGAAPIPLPAPGDPARALVARRLCESLKAVPQATRADALRRLHGALGLPDATAFPEFALMSWDEALALEERGTFALGAHTVSHPIVSRLSDAQVDAEIRGSIAEVARRAARPTRTFAYPNGRPEDFDARAVAAARAAGCVAAVSTREGLNGVETERFALRRITLAGEVSFDEFRFRTAGLNRVLAGAGGP